MVYIIFSIRVRFRVRFMLYDGGQDLVYGKHQSLVKRFRVYVMVRGKVMYMVAVIIKIKVRVVVMVRVTVNDTVWARARYCLGVFL